MPRTSVPAYRPVPGRDLARVTLDGKTFYLGKYGSEASHKKPGSGILNCKLC